MSEDLITLLQHRWNEYRRRVVEPVGSMADGTPAVVSMDEEDVKIFCEYCGIGLTEETRQQPCPGEWPPDEEDDELT